MEAFFVLLAIPLLGGPFLWLLGDREAAPEVNAAFSFATFAASAWLTAVVISGGPVTAWDEQFFVDALNVFLVALTAFVGFTTSLFSRPYMRIEREKGKMTGPRLRLYHSMYQAFMFTMLLALTTNNMGILWVAMEAATLATVLLVSVYRTAASLEAAWKYFILCGVGIAQALFGTILLYFAAERVLGAEGNALLWTHLNLVKADLEPAIMSLAFVFLLVGYGTKIGLVPLHNWLPDAHAEGPTPISAVLSGLLLNVALYSVIRCKVLADGALDSRFAGNMMMGFGLLSVVVAAFFLSRQRDVKRMFAYSSIEHMGLVTFAFGMGGPDRQLRGAAAHDGALAREERHLLRRGPRRAEGGHAAHGGHPRPHEGEPHRGLGAHDRHARDPGHAALRRVRERVPHPHHGDARAPVGDTLPAAGAGRGLRRRLQPRAAHGLRRHPHQAAGAPAGAGARVRAPGAGAAAGALHSALSRGVVSGSGAVAGIGSFNTEDTEATQGKCVFRA
jgi:hypothetical protein